MFLCGLLSSAACILYLHREDNVPPNISAATNEERRVADHRRAVGRHSRTPCDGRAPAWRQLPVSPVSPSKSGANCASSDDACRMIELWWSPALRGGKKKTTRQSLAVHQLKPTLKKTWLLSPAAKKSHQLFLWLTGYPALDDLRPRFPIIGDEEKSKGWTISFAACGNS